MSTPVETVALSTVGIGEQFRVVRVESRELEMRRRLADMGLHAGAEGTMLRIAPLGDPLLVRVMRASISLRRGEAEAVLVTRKATP